MVCLAEAWEGMEAWGAWGVSCTSVLAWQAELGVGGLCMVAVEVVGLEGRMALTGMEDTSCTPRQPSKLTSLRVIPEYSVLVIDSNIFPRCPSSPPLSKASAGRTWSPLVVITELDGITTNNSSLGEAVTVAIEYISSHVRSHSRSLKVQTSKDNYLQTLSIRSEQVGFAYES